MDLSAIIEVVIGLIFMWITLSLATIQIQEWIITLMDKRAKDMEASLHEMLANPNLKSQFYDHPVIRGLTAKKRKKPSPVPAWFYRYPIVRGFTREKRKLPSYIPSQDFALAMFDIAMTAGTESSLIQQGLLKIRDDLQKDMDNTRNRPRDRAVVDSLNILVDLARSAASTEAQTSITNYTKDVLTKEVNRLADQYLALDPAKPENQNKRRVGQALQKALREAQVIADTELAKVKAAAKEDELLKEKSNKGETDDQLAQLRQGIAALSVISPELSQSFSALLLNAEEYATGKEKQLAQARQNVESWFNNAMDRVSGVFKRYSQAMALILGIIFSLMLNVDSITLAQYLWREPTVRQILVDQAAKLQPSQIQSATNPQQTVQQFQQQFYGLNLPMGWDVARYGAAALYNSECQLFPHNNQYFGIPIFGSKICLTQPHSSGQTNILLKLLGIMITAGATAQGAPFWFDILKRLVNLRGTGPNPAEKEASK
jgi:hypothetical protein